jgi:hypothetical protein
MVHVYLAYFSLTDQINTSKDLQAWVELEVAVEVVVVVAAAAEVVNPNPARVKWSDLTSTHAKDEGCTI